MIKKSRMMKLNKKQILFYAGIISLSPFLFSFTGYNPSTNKDEIIFVSTYREKQIGRAVAKKVEKKFQSGDPLMQKRVESIGSKLADVCERKDIIYRFKVLMSEKDGFYNAFALPGGYVYIFEDLVNKMEADDEIAAILAHEIAHVAAKHSIQSMQASMGANIVMLLGLGMGADGQDMAQAGDAITRLMMAHSREAELEADKLAVRYLKKAGYDEAGIVRSLKRLKTLRKEGPIRKYTSYRTHPYLSERISRAKMHAYETVDFTSYINLPIANEKF